MHSDAHFSFCFMYNSETLEIRDVYTQASITWIEYKKSLWRYAKVQLNKDYSNRYNTPQYQGPSQSCTMIRPSPIARYRYGPYLLDIRDFLPLGYIRDSTDILSNNAVRSCTVKEETVKTEFVIENERHHSGDLENVINVPALKSSFSRYLLAFCKYSYGNPMFTNIWPKNEEDDKADKLLWRRREYSRASQ